MYAPVAEANPRFDRPRKARDGAGTKFEGTTWGVAVRRIVRGVARGSIDRNMTQRVADRNDRKRGCKVGISLMGSSTDIKH